MQEIEKLIKVSSRVSNSEFVDFGFDGFGEYIHAFPDVENRELRCYRSIEPSAIKGKKIQTVVEDVSFSFLYDDDNDERELSHFYLTSSQAMTFLSILDLYNDTNGSRFSFTWWEESGTPMHENSRIGEETINIKFEKENGVKRYFQIATTWSSPNHKMVRIPGEI